LSNLLITNIKQLVQVEENPSVWKAGKDMQDIGILNNAWLLISNGIITDFGTGSHPEVNTEYQIIDATNKLVLPTFVDSHTHIVYAGNREEEWVDRISGLSYEAIAEKGGGILNSAKKLQNTSEEELYLQAKKRLIEIIKLGTGAVEIKSGYGLTVADELKMLRVVKHLKSEFDIEIKATFLGAHAIPKSYNNRNEYIEVILTEMLPKVAAENLADFCDVFCEKGYFNPEETEKILLEAKKYGLLPKIHANQMSHSGGIAAGVNIGAISVDHLEFTSEQDIELLKNSQTMPTLLPGAAYFLHLPNPPARNMIDSGLPIALASDYNPGSSPSGNMAFVMSMGCIMFNMMPSETLNATTINTAYALGISDKYGSICKGKIGSVIITNEIPSYSFIPYNFATPFIDKVILKGKVFES
jgi:imidazolonepropionase